MGTEQVAPGRGRWRQSGWRRGAPVARVVAVAALIVVHAGCQPPGILYTLATEHPRRNRNLPNELTVTAVVSADQHYYVAAGGMWRRTHTGDDWQSVARPANDKLLVLGLAERNDTLCAGTEGGLFHAAATGAKPGWQPASGVTQEQVLRVFTVPHSPDGKVVAITQPKEHKTEYRVYASDDCRTFRPLFEQSVGGRPFDATYAFGEYWMTIGDQVYRGNLDGLEVAPEQPAGAGSYRGVFLNDAETWLYVADESGNIHSTKDRRTWTKTTLQPATDGVETLPLTLFTQIGDTILVGTERYGFYQFPDGNPGAAKRGPRITSQLYEAHVTGFARFYEDDGKLRVFAATAVAGLSSLDVDAAKGNFGTWDWE